MGFLLTQRWKTLDDLEPLVRVFEILQIHSLDGADVCSNLIYRPIIALFSCFDKKNQYN